MSKKPSKFEQFLAELDEFSADQRNEALASKPPEFWGREGLGKIGHKKRPILKVIRAYCLQCCVEQPKEVRLCQFVTCPLWPYRMGTDPFRKGREAENA